MNFVWSWSALECFEQCPKKFYHKYILREKEPPSPALIKGRAVHEACERAVKDPATLTPEDIGMLRPFYPLLRTVYEAAKGKRLYTELKMGLTTAVERCLFFDKRPDLWARSAADVLVVDYPNAFLGDWKTGKVREKKDQLALMTLFIFKHFPSIEKVTSCNIWLEAGKMGEPFIFTRAEEPALWTWILMRIRKMYATIESEKFCMMPGPLCGYCPVLSCPNNRS